MCCASAYLLAGSPLATAALIVAGVNLAAVIVSATRKSAPGRGLTALGHLTTALGGFFLFVWLAAR
jgi:hypothetical protein